MVEHWNLGPTCPAIHWVLGVFPPTVKWAVFKIDGLLPSSVEVKNYRRYNWTSLYTFMTSTGKSFTFIFTLNFVLTLQKPPYFILNFKKNVTVSCFCRTRVCCYFRFWTVMYELPSFSASQQDCSMTHLTLSSVGSLTNCGQQKHAQCDINGHRLLAVLGPMVLADLPTASYEWHNENVILVGVTVCPWKVT